MVAIPRKYEVSQVVVFIKGKSAIHLSRTYKGRSRKFVGQNFWDRGYFASMVGRDEEVIREYIRHQEEEDKPLDQMKLWR
jgi:putative transposase